MSEKGKNEEYDSLLDFLLTKHVHPPPLARSLFASTSFIWSALQTFHFRQAPTVSGRVKSPATQKCPRKVIQKVLHNFDSFYSIIYTILTELRIFHFKLWVWDLWEGFINVNQCDAIETINDFHWVTREMQHMTELHVNKSKTTLGCFKCRRNPCYCNMQIGSSHRFWDVEGH